MICGLSRGYHGVEDYHEEEDLVWQEKEGEALISRTVRNPPLAWRAGWDPNRQWLHLVMQDGVVNPGFFERWTKDPMNVHVVGLMILLGRRGISRVFRAHALGKGVQPT